DQKLARRLQAPRQARKGLSQAEQYLQQENQKLFYDTLFKTLQHYFASKFHLTTGIGSFQALESLIVSRKLNSGISEKLKRIFEECEHVRYASWPSDPAEMKANYELTQEIIDFFERNWK
ncbi:MAG: hypothetical protein NUV91_06535, partial [Candidatus Omnitrophica bacterium]|nr:hypothetical protein [Candidatus Omnitrophota bacterium]